MEWGSIILEMFVIPDFDYFGVDIVYFIRILYFFCVILKMFEWF